jgi:hypothetical protein
VGREPKRAFVVTISPNDENATPAGDCTCLETQNVVQHNGDQGHCFRLMSPTYGPAVPLTDEQIENAPKDSPFPRTDHRHPSRVR